MEKHRESTTVIPPGFPELPAAWPAGRRRKCTALESEPTDVSRILLGTRSRFSSLHTTRTCPPFQAAVILDAFSASRIILAWLDGIEIRIEMMWPLCAQLESRRYTRICNPQFTAVQFQGTKHICKYKSREAVNLVRQKTKDYENTLPASFHTIARLWMA